MPTASESPNGSGQAASAVDEARGLGRGDARAFDQSLRLEESRHRELRLSELAWFAGAGDERTDSADGYEVAKLRRRVEEQDYLLEAIENSAAWRWIQRVRGWFGRAW